MMSKALQRAIDLIEDPARWTTGAAARDADGTEVALDDSTAVCRCAWAAMDKEGVSALMKWHVDDYCRYGFADGYGVSFINDGPDGHARILQAMRAVQGGWKLGDTPTTVMKITRKQT